MNELASKLFKTFFRSKKSFLSSELELVKVASKTDFFKIFNQFSIQNPNGSLILCSNSLIWTANLWVPPKKCQQFCAIFCTLLNTSFRLHIRFYISLVVFLCPKIRNFDFFMGNMIFTTIFAKKYFVTAPNDAQIVPQQCLGTI